ncbi:ABC transporter substrate-binding protein [Endozoicomonas sp. SM1973]|uniref:ABC transporter substrate-binding protein n=1 Tax=Spartinivicinus marinus TaxID=2994442 RepID=A0A853IC10_9GAMM|nr:ABC transporter substrate-binding protein [Spartinivicinus marinus]MCX4025913.1 ABC transporter substrate-binding protein [Spartinivicinus marinus]NYZ68098.1 ABC transporter substrate-binding protein [Spartinivicinus marinus]
MKTIARCLSGGLSFGLLLLAKIAFSQTLTISCGAVGAELSLCKEAVSAWTKKTGHQVEVISTPNSSTERLALYQQIFSAKSSDIDVFQIDIIWPGLLANHLVDLSPYTKGVEKQHFPTLVENNTVSGKLVAMPWFVDTAFLYYRKDLLEKYNQPVPTTWQQLSDIGKTIQNQEHEKGNAQLWGYVWQGRAYEGLTCNALEWLSSYNGGSIVDNNGKITVNSKAAESALSLAGQWVGQISPPGVLNYTEEEARGVFQSGNAVFMRNWPYAWALAQGEESAIKGKVGIVALPKGGPEGKHASTLGGWQLAVSKYSKYPKLAADLTLFLTSYDIQKQRLLKGAFNPTIKSLYEDQEVIAAAPVAKTLVKSLEQSVARPSTATKSKYNQVSNLFFNAVHNVLAGKEAPKQALKKLEKKLKRIKRKKWN